LGFRVIPICFPSLSFVQMYKFSGPVNKFVISR